MIKQALIFPGQSSQAPKMGQEVAQRYPQCMEYWEKAEEYSALPLRDIYWNECSEENMAKTVALQPALTALQLSLLYCYQQTRSYDAVAGHSLGEFPALCAAGILSVEDTLILTTERGKLMEKVNSGGKLSMIAVLKLPLQQVQEIVEKIQKEHGMILFIANHNSTSQYILSGEKSIFPYLTELVTEAKGRAITFPIAGAFHSPFMQEAQDMFAPYLENVTWNNANVPFYSNVTASPLTDAMEIKEAMKKQITSSVLFVDILHAMRANGIEKFIELTAKPMCSSFVKATLSKDVQIEFISTFE